MKPVSTAAVAGSKATTTRIRKPGRRPLPSAVPVDEGRTGASTCEMPVRRCGAAAVLLDGGPVRVPFRACCATALVQGLRGTSGNADAADEGAP